MFERFISFSITTQILIIYGICINIIAFFYFGVDKLKARFHESRLSERTLWIMVLIGGSVGGLAGMHYFRHKTKKMSFQAIIAIILALQIILASLLAG